MEQTIFDTVILGGGPAGYTAALYAARANFSVLLLEKLAPGGQMATTDVIDNYPGFPEGIHGFDLAVKMKESAERFGVQTKLAEVVEAELTGEIKEIKTKKETFFARTVVLATGARPRELGLPGERELRGRGVSYCATCDGNFFEDFEIYVVGGGDSAVEEALYLTKFGRKVTLIHRRDELRAAKSIQEKAFANPKMEFMWDSVIEELKGDDILTSMVVKNVKTGEVKEIQADPEDGTFGVFVFIGYDPQSKVFEGKVNMEHGYIVTDENMKTNIPGVFAAGDIRVKSLRQVVTAAADGAIAAVQCEKYLG